MSHFYNVPDLLLHGQGQILHYASLHLSAWQLTVSMTVNCPSGFWEAVNQAVDEYLGEEYSAIYLNKSGGRL